MLKYIQRLKWKLTFVINKLAQKNFFPTSDYLYLKVLISAAKSQVGRLFFVGVQTSIFHCGH